MSDSSNSRIAKNTIVLYIRTIIILAVSLYTSRLVLKALGVVDLGIFNVVGGVVSLMSFMRIALTKSTGRFITYEIGRNSEEKSLAKVFSIAMTIHIIIASFALLLGETIGLYILENWTVIPEIRRQAAFVIYQAALLVFILQLITVPYESVVIANENMKVFAYMTILSALLKLGVVFIMLGSDIDRLILYGVAIVAIDSLIFAIYFIIVKIKYPAFRFHLLWDKNYSSQMFVFSGWTLVGSSANVATQQGVSLLFNNFVGLIANAALGFANQINGAVQQFYGSFQTAFNPQVIKLYANNNFSRMHLLMERASKFSFLLTYVIALPLIVNMDFVLHIWLDEVPKYTVEFCQLILICCIIDATTGVFNTAITATGTIKNYQLAISMSYVLDLAASSIMLVSGFTPVLVFGSRILTRGVLNMIIGFYFVHKLIGFSVSHYMKTVFVSIILTLLLTVPLLHLTGNCFKEWSSLIFSYLFTMICCAILVWVIYLDRDERKKIIEILSSKLNK